MVDIFESLPPDEIEEIQARCPEIRVEAGEVFFSPEDLCETLFILQEGRVRIYKKTPEEREFTLAVFGGDTVFGEAAFTTESPCGSYAEALEPSTVSAISRANLERLILARPQVGLQLTYLMGERLTRYESRMEALGPKEVPARLAGLILQLLESEGVKTGEDYKIPAHYTHQQLGTMIGANREAVTRAFAHLQDIEAVELRRRRIHVTNLDFVARAAR
ncbi:Crp/Fnr family transcriptional regulator [soil metagenome]